MRKFILAVCIIALTFVGASEVPGFVPAQTVNAWDDKTDLYLDQFCGDGHIELNGNEWLYRRPDGTIDYNYNGLVKYQGYYFVVRYGKVPTYMSGLCRLRTEQTNPNGTLISSTVRNVTVYIACGRVLTEFSGIVPYNGDSSHKKGEYYISHGIWKWDYTGYYSDENHSYYIGSGIVMYRYH